MKDRLGRQQRVLLVDDDPGLLRLLTIRLKSEGYDVAACESAAQAQTSIPRFKPDVVLTDLRMAEQDGIGLLKVLQGRYPSLPVIMMTAHGTIPDAVEATRSGAFAFLTKPIDKDELLEQLDKAFRVSGFAGAAEDWRNGIVTRSPLMEDRLAQALAAASSDAPVLITGRPGTGKARLARAIHMASSRRGARFITVNCSTADAAALEAALKGQRAGDDAPPQQGWPAGSIFLVEVSNLTPAAQGWLAGVFCSGLGTTQTDRPRPRVLSATVDNLQQLVARAQFREDLCYTLSATRIEVPSLAQRREDIPLLAAHFLEDIAQRQGIRRVLAPEALEVLMTAEWPGNIRQLATLVGQVASLATGPVISAELVQQNLGDNAARIATFDEARDEFTRNYLIQLLQITRGNVTQAARLAGRNRTDFYKLLGRHEIAPDEFKTG
jgi:two-component system response regulator GlrR